MEINLTSGGSVADWRVGDVINSRYQLVDRIGLGGMGAVWEILDREWDRTLALKVPLPALVGSVGLKERFVREAETWVSLGVHPHIVQCWYVLSIADLPCLFLDFLPGGSLKDRIQNGDIAPGQWGPILEMALGIASGLVHAHSRGVVHRDIKPENLLFRPDGRICVTDFGLVKTIASKDSLSKTTPTKLDGPKSPGVSGAGAYLGTPQYGAPEQWGAAESVGLEADIYAFGITLYELCAGRRPFDIEGDTSVSVYDLINAHLKLIPPDPRTFRADIPEELVLLSLACLEKDPNRRPPSMKAVYEVLAAIYQTLTSQTAPEVVTLPNTGSPDILNNAAVSMLSLGKTEQAQKHLRRGLRIESDHPECLYNLTQIERQEATIGTQEALRRLQQAKANFPLALLCIEQGLAKEAVAILGEVNTSDPIKMGLTRRALGDANMYLHQYFVAEQAYRQALKLLPNDEYTNERKMVAAMGQRSFHNRILFPLTTPRWTLPLEAQPMRLFFNDEGTQLIVYDANDFRVFDPLEACGLARVEHAKGTQVAEYVWTHDNRVLIQEPQAFQLRLLPELLLIGRKGGRVLAQAPDLSRLVLLTHEGPTLFSFEENTFEPIHGMKWSPGQPSPLAAFDQSGDLLCLMLSDGRLAQLDEDLNVDAWDWPNPKEYPSKPQTLALASSGIVYIGFTCGTLRAYNATTRTLTYAIKFPGPIAHLQLTAGDHNLLVRVGGVHVLIDSHGERVWQGTEPTKLEGNGRRLLAFVRGTLHLYQCHPFYLIRRWSTEIKLPRELAVAGCGNLAASHNASGQIHIWEIAEDHRVYERSPLLAIGQSYDELIQGAQRFPLALKTAQEAFEIQDFISSYKALREARSIAGYGQAPEALDLTWNLLKHMGRDQLDAVWDRFTTKVHKPGPIALSPSGDHLLISADGALMLREETTTSSHQLWSYTPRHSLIAVKFEPSAVLVIDERGQVTRLTVDKGELIESFSMEIGQSKLRCAHLLETSFLFTTDQGAVGQYDIKNKRLAVVTSALAEQPHQVYPWVDTYVIVSSPKHCGIVDLAKPKNTILQPFSSKTYRPSSPISFAHHDRAHRVIILGSTDGMLAITDAETGHLVYAISNISGAITGFALLSRLATGIVTTDRGELYFWDLTANRLLQGLLAHRSSVLSLAVDSRGRYLATTGKDGQVHLWETSWTASLSLEEDNDLAWLPKASSTGFFSRLFKKG